MQNDLEVETRTLNPAPQHPACSSLLERGFHDAIAKREFTTDVDKRQMAVHGVRRDDHSLDQLMRIAFEDDAILAGARLAFVGVATQVGRLPGVLRNKTPLHAGWKAGAPAT